MMLAASRSCCGCNGERCKRDAAEKQQHGIDEPPAAAHSLQAFMPEESSIWHCFVAGRVQPCLITSPWLQTAV